MNTDKNKYYLKQYLSVNIWRLVDITRAYILQTVNANDYINQALKIFEWTMSS